MMLSKPKFEILVNTWNLIDSSINSVESLSSEPDVIQRASDLFVEISNLADSIFSIVSEYGNYSEFSLGEITTLSFITELPAFGEMADFRQELKVLKNLLSIVGDSAVIQGAIIDNLYKQMNNVCKSTLDLVLING